MEVQGGKGEPPTPTPSSEEVCGIFCARHCLVGWRTDLWPLPQGIDSALFQLGLSPPYPLLPHPLLIDTNAGSDMI